jgi:hypothetical protein
LLPGFTFATTINFDDLSPGTVVSTIQDVTFTSSVTPEYGLDLIVSSVFDTSSGENSLGVDDGGTEVFLPGDTIDLLFATPITSLSVNFISTSNTPPNTYSITTPAGSSSNGSTPDAILPDTGEVFTVLFSSATPFTTAQLYGGAGGAHSYNIDDITFSTVPLPPSILLFLSGFLLMGRLIRTQRNRLSV